MKNEIRQIAIKINTLKDLDLFENSRKRDVVESRAVFTYILYKFYNMGCTQIRDLYRSQGKAMDHATVLHALRNWEIYVLNNASLEDLVIAVMTNTEFEKDQDKIRWITSKLNYLNSEQVQEVYEEVEQKFTELCLNQS